MRQSILFRNAALALLVLLAAFAFLGAIAWWLRKTWTVIGTAARPIGVATKWNLSSIWSMTLVGLVSAMHTSVLIATQYEFEKIVDSNSGIGDLIEQAPAINNHGSVLFQTEQTSSDAVYLSHGGGLSQVYNAPFVFGNNFDITGTRQLNNNDEVVFSGTQNSTSKIFTWSNGTLSTLYTSFGPANSSLRSVQGQPAINDQGAVVFSGSGWNNDDTIFLGNNNPPQVLVSGAAFSSLRSPVINNAGAVAYYGATNGVSEAIYLTSNGTTNVIASMGPPGKQPALFVDSITNSGQVLYQVRNSSANTYTFYLGDATHSTKIVDNLGAFAGLGEPAINNAGAVAFLGMTQSGGVSARAIYTGADPVSDRILGTGDMLFGGRISDIYLGPQGINDQGDLVFFADLVDPNTGAFESDGIYVAIPTPEPSSLVLAAVGFLALAAWGWRRVRLQACGLHVIRRSA